ncbi:MAG: hypothetical protein AB7P76_12710 [Candidatus Melainabacteria bacterium]
MITLARTAPIFGWSYGTHTHLNQVATQRLPSSAGGVSMNPFRSLLNELQPDIDWFSIQEDHDPNQKGNSHVLDMETIHHFPIVPTDPKRNHSFETIDRVFTEKNKDAVSKVPVSLLDLLPVSHSDNLVNDIQSQYGKLVELLRQWRSHTQSANINEKTEIAKTMGRLTHKIQDATQPAHLTSYSMWQTANPWRSPVIDAEIPFAHDNSHCFLENGIFLRKQVNQNTLPGPWNEDFQGLPATMSVPDKPRNMADILADLPGQFKKTYLKLFDIVEVDRQARKAHPKTEDAQGYFRALQEGWKPIVTEQLQLASQLTTEILQAAWMEASRPVMVKTQILQNAVRPSTVSA